MELSTEYDYSGDEEELRFATIQNNRNVDVEVVKLPTPTAPPESFYTNNNQNDVNDVHRNCQTETQRQEVNNEKKPNSYNYEYYNNVNPFELQHNSGQEPISESAVANAKKKAVETVRRETTTVSESMTKVEFTWMETKLYYIEHYSFDVLDFSTKRDLNAVFADGFHKGQFFTEEEVERLKLQPMPVDRTTILTTREWNAVMKKSKYDGARFDHSNVLEDDMHGGIMSPDNGLEDSDDISQFFIRNNYRPRLFLHVKYDSQGTSHRSTIDLTSFVFPFGKLLYVGKHRSEIDGTRLKTLFEIFDDYLDSENKMKCLQMTKKVYFDFATLNVLVKEFLALEYNCKPSQISCKITLKRTSVRLYANTVGNKFWDSIWGRIISGVTIVPGIAMSIYAEDGRWRDIRSHFTILYTPFQLFHLIRPKLFDKN